MTRLRGHYLGFTIGMRVGDSFLPQLDIDSKIGEATRHALRNIALSSRLTREPEVFAVDNQFYAGVRE